MWNFWNAPDLRQMECNRSIQNVAVRSWKFTPQRALKMDHHVELHDLGFCIYPSPGCVVIEPILKSAENWWQNGSPKTLLLILRLQEQFEEEALFNEWSCSYMRAGSRGIFGVRWKICHFEMAQAQSGGMWIEVNLHVSCLYPSIV